MQQSNINAAACANDRIQIGDAISVGVDPSRDLEGGGASIGSRVRTGSSGARCDEHQSPARVTMRLMLPPCILARSSAQ